MMTRSAPFAPLAMLFVATSTLSADPRTDLWWTDASARYARIYTSLANRLAGSSTATWSNGSQSQNHPAYCGVQAVLSSSDWVYIRTTGLGSHVMGPWPANFPNLPANQHVLYRLPRHPVLGASGTPTGLGAIGYLVDGVAMFDSRDGFVWTGSTEQGGAAVGYWNRDAFVNEGATFDPAYAHQENSGTYHCHANPVALRHLLGDHVDYDSTTGTYRESPAPVTRHSPLLGWVRDGWPLYGPYGYAEATRPSSGLARMRAGYQLRDGQRGTDNIAVTGRSSLPAWAVRAYGVTAAQPGPAVSATYPRGRYMEDHAYLGDLGLQLGTDFDLDEYNGRWCVTPEYPDGTYAYFVSIAADGTPVFPYNIGRSFRSAPTGAAVQAVAENVTTHFVGGTNVVASLATPSRAANGGWILQWNGIEGGGYTVEHSDDLKAWTPVTEAAVSGPNPASAVIASAGDVAAFRVRLVSVDTHDAVDSMTGGGGPVGPAIATVSPTSGGRGLAVRVTFTLGGQAPPANLLPTSATLGTLAGSAIARNGAQVSATFSIPANATPGPVNAAVVFPGPPGMGAVTFSVANAFTIL